MARTGDTTSETQRRPAENGAAEGDLPYQEVNNRVAPKPLDETPPLTDRERTELDACEAVIQRGLRSFLEVGEALMRIREGRLYRETHPSFEAYTRERWNLGRAHGYRLMQAAEVAGVLSPMGDTSALNERQARELVPLLGDPDRLAEVWRQALEATDGKPTAKTLAAVRDDADQLSWTADMQERVGRPVVGTLDEYVTRLRDIVRELVNPNWTLRGDPRDRVQPISLPVWAADIGDPDPESTPEEKADLDAFIFADGPLTDRIRDGFLPSFWRYLVHTGGLALMRTGEAPYSAHLQPVLSAHQAMVLTRYPERRKKGRARNPSRAETDIWARTAWDLRCQWAAGHLIKWVEDNGGKWPERKRGLDLTGMEPEHYGAFMCWWLTDAEMAQS